MLDVGDVDGDAGTFACFLNLVIVCGDGLMTSVFVTLSEACLRVAPGALCAHVAQALHSSREFWGPQSPALFIPLFSNFVTTSILVLSFC